MEEYLVPTGFGEDEFTEKKSRFIGRVWQVDTEQEALDQIREIRKQYPDATHHCWAYVIRDGAMRFSDDGEPGGTAGNPMMQVLQKEKIYNVLCVVTRYFGGTLLGAGGLVRAYTKGAKIALNAAGRSVKRAWAVWSVPCSYGVYQRLRPELESRGAVIRDVRFGAQVEMEIFVAETQTGELLEKIRDLTNGTVTVTERGQEYRAFPVEEQV